MYVLMISRDEDMGVAMVSIDEPAGVFTERAGMETYVIGTPLPEGAAYYALECQPNQPGIFRRIDMAVEAIEGSDRGIEGSPVQVVVPVGEDGHPLIQLDNLPPFAIEIFGAKVRRSLLRLFESPAGLLEAQYRPEDLTEAAQQFVTELQKIQMRAYGVTDGE